MSIDFCDDLARAARHKDGRKFERQLNSVGRRTLRLFTLFRRLRFLLLIPIIGIGAIVACAPSPPEPPAAPLRPLFCDHSIPSDSELVRTAKFQTLKRVWEARGVQITDDELISIFEQREDRQDDVYGWYVQPRTKAYVSALVRRYAGEVPDGGGDPTPMNRSRASKSFGEEDYGKAEAA
jgi:hypothetical protein